MKITDVNATVTQLTRFGLINAYLVREDDGLTLVDTTIAGAAEDLLRAAASRNLPLRRILLTHAHGDHIGSLDALHGRHPSLEVLISARDARLLHKDLSLDPSEPGGPSDTTRPRPKIKGSTPGAQTLPTRLLYPGDSVGSLLCVPTPGHTPGHMSFFDVRNGTLLAGDALVTVGGRLELVTNAPWFFPLPSAATWHPPTAVSSITRLLDGALPATLTTVAPGHGPALPSTRNELAEATARATRKLHP